MTATITVTVTVTRLSLVESDACSAGLAFFDAVADGADSISFELTPLAWVWLEAEGCCWASWLRLPLPSLAGADLRSACLASVDLRGTRLAGADLRDADLAGANLEGAQR